MELAGDEERRGMEQKERKQKDFFAAMEANILNSISQGQVPGSPKETALLRKKSSIRPATGVRPELVRTISTMDQSMLSNLIRRQPSFRNVVKKRGAGSLMITDLKPSRQGSARGDGFDSFVSVVDDRHHLDPLSEVGDDSLPELFNYLPDDDPGADYSSDENSVELELGRDSSRSDAGKFNESSGTGFGLTREETQALKRLASITKEMMDVEDDDDDDDDIDLLGKTFESAKLKASAGGTPPSWKSKGTSSKEMRDLPRELEFDDDSESEGESPRNEASATSLFQKAKDIGGERNFEDSDSEDESSNFQPTPLRQKSLDILEEKKSPKTEDTAVRPEVKRRNTCGTVYVGTTMSAPDKDATIKVG
jgi:hypothetical protein